MSSSYQLGYTRMMEAINGGEDLAALLMGLFVDRRRFADLISGSVSCLVACYTKAFSIGARPAFYDKDLEVFMSGSLTTMGFDLAKSLNSDDGELQGRQLSALVTAVTGMHTAGYRWSKSAASEQALPVRVIGMPDRVTNTEVVRDGAKIIGSIQRETDCFAT